MHDALHTPHDLVSLPTLWADETLALSTSLLTRRTKVVALLATDDAAAQLAAVVTVLKDELLAARQKPAVSADGDESVNGTWQLRVIDTRRGTVGTLKRWSLVVGSRWD